ncbi:hypothetical protein O3M35_001217 [Rhynocoris fuscipes]|uniref:Nuclear pore complex protein Nup153 n=1 Tax=Rhynocoris fuscipes TaxID=488301 RepID=A0AAW1DQF0_9HEMI
MFRRKSDVDKHVKDLLRKVKNEHERNLRCYHIASMYYKAQDYESAKKYVSMYLSVRDDSSLAHKLLGQCYEGLNLKDKALSAYRRSLELEANQAELILKICELLCDKNVTFDPIMARYWADRASSLFPHDPSVFMLKEKLLTADDNIASNDLENLLHSELKARPTDVSVRIKLLNLYVDSNRTEQALKHAFDVEARQAHTTNLSWYQCLHHICEVYHKEFPSKCDWEFYIHWMSAIDRVCSLSLSEILQGSDLTGSTEIIYNLDQILFRANSTVLNPSEFYKEFIKYIGAQLMFHITILLLKRAKKQGNGLWKETKRMIVPLLLMATLETPDLGALRNIDVKETHQKLLKTWINHSRCRIVQAGQMLLSLVKEVQSEKVFLEKVFHFTVNNWKQQIFQKVFSSIEDLNHSSSYFLTSNLSIPQKIPSQHNFKPSIFVSNFESVYVGSLHHLVWLGIQCLQNSNSIVKCKIAPSFRTTYFKNLQFTISSLNNVGVETLNQLDIDSFLYATVFCAGLTLEDQKVNGYFPPDKPLILPADISVPLCTMEQSKWWKGACSITKSGADSLSQAKNAMSELRHLLQRGLEIVRGENIPLPLIINLARTFSHRAADSDKLDEAEGCEARALHLWQIAIPQLERLSSGQSINKYQKTNKFFDFPAKDFEIHEINGLLEEARYFVGCHLMKLEKYEDAIESFKNLNSAQAAFQQALIYQTLAEQQMNGYRGEEVTSEMRCNQAVMAAKARDSLFRARDMVKDNHSHPYYNKIKDKLIEVDELLSRIEPEKNNSNLFSFGEKDNCNTDGNLSCESGGSPVLVASNSRANHTHRIHLTSTPNRHFDTKHRNNSADVVDILTMQQNTSQLKIQQVLEHLKLALEKIEGVIFEQRSQRNLIEELTNKFTNLEVETKNVLSDIKKEVKRPDLYNMIDDEEYTDEMLQYQHIHLNPSTNPYYQPQRNVQNSATVTYGPPAMPHYFSPRVDQMYQGNLGFYNQGALPFSDGQQLPDFLRTMQPKLPPSLSTPQGIASLQTSLGLAAAAAAAGAPAPPVGGLNSLNRLPSTSFHAGPSLVETNRIPSNVVITTSDTLPKSAPSVQPTLSVTIPPQHRLGDVSSAAASAGAPHQFQIHLPQQSAQQQLQQQQHLQLHHQQQQQQQQLQQHQTRPQPQLEQSQNMQKSVSEVESEDEAATSESTNLDYDSTSDSHHQAVSVPKESLFEVRNTSMAASSVDSGAEQEEVMFVGRAKLLRFVDKNWKEKGTGDLKILKDKSNNKARILMRREKVHKVCANHFLTPDMELFSMQPSTGTAWCWSANDFSDGAMVTEKFCAKFKSVEDGQRFKEVFDKVKTGSSVFPAKESSTASTLTGITQKPVTTSSISTTNSSLFTSTVSTTTQSTNWFTSTSSTSTAPNKINAGGFTFLSPPKFQVPEEQKVSKPVETKKTESPFANLNFSAMNQTSSSNASGTGFSLCPATTNSYFSQIDKNAISSTPATNTKSSPFSTSQSSFMGGTSMFSFQGSKLFGDNVSSLANQSTNDINKFPSPFQGAGSKIFGDNDSTAKASVKTDGDGTQNTEDDFESTAVFEPVVPLPELVQVVSGEEGETVLFEERAKLYRFCKETKQWKERGIGKMKILKNEETGVVRLVMRREQVFKVCCNHRLTKDIVLSPSTTSDRSYSWAAKDFSEENSDGVNEIFTLKLKNQEQALAFKEAFEKAQANLADSSPQKAKEQSSVSPAPNKDSSSSFTSFSFGIPQVTPQKSTTTNHTSVTNTTQEKQPSLSSLIQRPAGSWTCDSCYVCNKAEDTVCVACNSSKSGPAGGFSYNSTKFESSGIFGGNLAGSTTTSDNQFNLTPQKPGTSGSFVFGFGINTKDTTSEEASKGPKPVFNFGVPSSLDSQTAKSTFTFKLNKPTTLATTSSPQKRESGSEHGDSDNEACNEESDAYFQPVIPLPEKITVVTGEEDETVLYSHRAKLFRYDSVAKEWKERGLGDIKILQHNVNGKVRLLLRREPIFKISLNHFLTPDIVMKKKDDRSWIWFAQDFASGEVIREQFAIRFKTPDIAQEFKEAVENAQKNNNKPPVKEKVTESSNEKDDDVEILYEQKVSDELRKKAESLMLPSNFYSYLYAKPCSGCAGCKNEDDDDEITITKTDDIKKIESTKDNESIKKSEDSSSTKKEANRSILRQPLLSSVQTSNVTKSESPKPVKTESPEKQKSDTTGQIGSTGKENIVSRGFFTQPSFTNTSSPFTPSIFGGSSVETSQRSIFGGASTFTPEAGKSSAPSIFGGTAELKPNQTLFFGGTPSEGIATNASTPKFMFGGGDSGNGDQAKPNQSQLSGATAKEPENQSHTSIFGGNMPSFSSLSNTTSPFGQNQTAPQSFFGLGSDSGNGNQAKPQQPQLSGGARSSEPDGLPLSTNNMVSFSALSSMRPAQAFVNATDNANVKWEGAGSTVFGGRSKLPETKNVNTSVGSDDGNDEAPEHDPHFEPIIALPDLIDLKTGEEDEHLLFNERAKLYRFDSKAREWKERGVGQMKILKHKENNVYRLLMRREIVHKVVCNQRITPDIDLKPLNRSDQAFCWSAMNMAQEYEQPIMENLSVKFKNKELASAFKKHIDDAIKEIKGN